MKIIFMGSAAFAVSSLDALHNAGHNILTVVTQPDKPAGRGRRLTSAPATNEAKQLGLPIYQPKSVKSPEVIEKLRNLDPDLIVVVAYGKILPKELIDIPPMGCVNVHASLLPKYRGAAPINWAITNGENETGVTTMFINESLDSGNILLKKSIAIDLNDTSITVHDKLAPLGAELLIGTIDELINGSLKPKPQDNSMATLAPMLKKEDGLIDWTKDSGSIRNLIRGMQPWPSAYTYLDRKILKIFNAAVINEAAIDAPGSVKASDDKIVITTGSGKISVNELQLEGKRHMTAQEFLNGHQIDNVVLG